MFSLIFPPETFGVSEKVCTFASAFASCGASAVKREFFEKSYIKQKKK